MRAPEKVGPDLRLHEHDGCRMDCGDSAPGPESAVDRIVELDDVGRQLALQLGHARRRGSGNDDFEVRQARFESGDELRANVDFADAYGVQPKHMTIR